MSGTLLYSKGDEKRVQEQMEEEEELYAQEEEEGKQAAALPGLSSAEEGLPGAASGLQRQGEQVALIACDGCFGVRD